MEEQSFQQYKLENEYLIITICNYGARIIQFISKQHNNIDIVDGMPFDKDKLINCPEQYFSATVGPICNRISYGSFNHDGKVYNLTQNQQNSCCHSNGLLSTKIWKFVKQTENEIVLSFQLPQREWEFNCLIFASFKINKNQLIINYTSDIQEPTPLALTSHPFFNLDGSKTCENIIIQIPSSQFVELNQYCCSGNIKQVTQTFDFRQPKSIEQDINDISDQQIQQGRGYDHCFILDDNQQIKKACIAYSQINNLKLSVFTNQPSIHFYTGKNNTIIGKRHSFCIECEQIPDSINRKDLENYGKIWYQPGEKYNNLIIYQVE